MKAWDDKKMLKFSKGNSILGPEMVTLGWAPLMSTYYYTSPKFFEL